MAHHDRLDHDQPDAAAVSSRRGARRRDRAVRNGDQDRRGGGRHVAESGNDLPALVAGELVAWVRARYAAGDRRLQVTDWAGRQIGGISRRCWWADPTWPQPGPDNSIFEQSGG